MTTESDQIIFTDFKELYEEKTQGNMLQASIITLGNCVKRTEEKTI